MGVRRATIIVFILVLQLSIGVQLVHLTYGNFFPDPGPDLPQIYIRSDGNIQPTTSLIERRNNIYELKENIVNFTLVIQCDNVILDGQGYSIQGNASRIKGFDDGNNGIIVDNQENVTIRNIFFEKGETGVRISNSSDLTIANNSFSNGICTGITLQDSTQILIYNNRFMDLLTDLNSQAIMLNGSKIMFRNNIVTGSSYGIMIRGSSNIISENTIECLLPIQMDNAESTILSFNIISGPASWADQIPFIGNEGIALFSRCSDNIIYGNNITGFVNNAIRTVFSCSNNTFYGNYIANTGVAISFQDGSINNTFYCNSIALDSCKVRINDNVFGTSWNNGTLGNYWADYIGTDNDEDGIGDSPYAITGVKWDTNLGGDVSFIAGYDNYPLTNPLEMDTIAEFPYQTILSIVLIFSSLVIMIIRNKLGKKK
ncbi:MAG: NosD domain-containing protein [Candidatus Bathyarchaeota archaeon]